MEISKKQKEFLELMADPQITEVLFGGSAGCPLVFGSKVKTPFGEKDIEEIKVGDQVSNASGGVSRVIDIPYEGIDECYKITFVDGITVECSGNHIWKYKLARNTKRKHLEEFSLGTTKQIISKMKKYNVLIPLTKPVVFTRVFRNVDKMSPYLLGVLLGDGNFTQRVIGISNPDMDIIERCRNEACGEIVGGKDGISWRLINCPTERERLRKFGLWGKRSWEKFIPECYKFGSIEERRAIIQGLFDTDGSVDMGGHLSFTSTSKQLAEDVQFILRSLGANATLTVDNNAGYRLPSGEFKRCRPAYTVYVQHEHKEWFITTKRKLERIKPYNGGAGVPNKRIIKIEPIGKKKVRCISVSNLDGLFLTNDFVVTHNSKSYSIGLLISLWSKMYPEIKFFVGRKTLKSLKQSTIATLLGKVLPSFGITAEDYHMGWQDMELTFKNGSKVIFGELDYHPSDPLFTRVGSLEVDVAILDEAGEVSKIGKDAIRSRIGRGVLSQKYGIPGKLILASNPDMGWLKSEYYDPYEKLGGGEFQKWQIGEVTLNEGEENEKKVPAYRGFLRATAYDNPFLPESYIDNLKSLPDILKKRLLDGNWNYADEDNMLFKSGLIEKAITYDMPERKEGFNKFIGTDVAAGSGDRTVYTLIENGVATIQKVSKVTANWDKKNEQPLFRLMADELIEFAQRNGFAPVNAKNIIVEGNGIGQALITTLKERGWYITEYTATHKSRSENYYQLSMDMDSGELKIYHRMSWLDELRGELAGHTFEFQNQTPSVCKKDDVKKRIGKSPDLADSLMIANMGRYRADHPELDPRRNLNRLWV